MRIGYQYTNITLSNKNINILKLKSYSDKKFEATVKANLQYLKEVLKYNIDSKIYLFRISTDIIPFASDPACKFKWKDKFKRELNDLGEYIRANDIRIMMHPYHFVILNTDKKNILDSSVRELAYLTEFMDSLKLDSTAKIQVHVGDVYKNREESIRRFVSNYQNLDRPIKNRLIIENDEKYSLSECLSINKIAGMPLAFDYFYHKVNCSINSLEDSFRLFIETWSPKDGTPIVDYSSQKYGEKKGKHSSTINLNDFSKNILNMAKDFKFDIMLEIRDKERSARKAINLAKKMNIPVK